MRRMDVFRSVLLAAAVFGPFTPSYASPVDAVACLTAAEQIDAGEKLSDQEREEAHQACLRALSATASVIQKYQFQEADFLITGKRQPLTPDQPRGEE